MQSDIHANVIFIKYRISNMTLSVFAYLNLKKHFPLLMDGRVEEICEYSGRCITEKSNLNIFI